MGLYQFQDHMRRRLPLLLAGTCLTLLAACGGGSSIGSGSAANSGPTASTGTTADSVAVTVDRGPASLATLSPPEYTVNVLYATVTICTPGSTTECQSIDHVQVDTGSYGFSVNASLLNGSVTPAVSVVNGGPLRECDQYADGYTWGSIVTVDVTIGTRTISSLPMNLIGDPAAGTAPASCSSGGGSNLNSVADFGANGIIGIGYFQQDCGQACETTAYSGLYYNCPSSGCAPTVVPGNQQQQNPISALSTDNNGAILVLPAVADTGQATVTGTLFFGIGTETNNGAGSASFLTVSEGGSSTEFAGSLYTVFNGSTLSGSVVDSGSNAYFFADSALTACSASTDAGFYCSSATLNGTLQGLNGTQLASTFNVGDADTLASSGYSALPTLAGSNATTNGLTLGFDWGLPFFYGRAVYILFEGSTSGTVTGPAVGL